MPSFAFWKNPKSNPDNGPSVREPLLEGPQEATTKIDLNPRNQDSGTFTFEDMELLPDCQPTRPLSQLMQRLKPAPPTLSIGQVDEDAPLLDDEHIESQCGVSPVDRRPETTLMTSEQSTSSAMPLLPRNASSKQTITGVNTAEPISPGQYSGSHQSCREAISLPMRPVSATSIQDTTPPRPSSFSLRQSSSPPTDPTPRRLHRPTELNLGSITLPSSKPQSELEKQFSLMRNSKTQSKAALRSPTQLLQQRLSMSTKKCTQEVKERVFIPPVPPRNGCLLPGPAGQMEAFTSSSVCARTEGGRPAWWCKNDKLVVFDGISVGDGGETKIHTRTSKGLSIARRRGDTETVVMPMNCKHCQEMLNRHEWKYDIQVCKRSVCWDCRERCKWEEEQAVKEREDEYKEDTEANRERADSVLQDDEPREEDLMRKTKVEQWRPKSPMEAVGNIEERLINTRI
jgi:hypothetical protein